MKKLLIVLIVAFFYACSSNIDSAYVKKNGKRIKKTFSGIVISKREDLFLIEDKRYKPSLFVELKKKKNVYVIESNLNESDKQRYISIIETLENLNFEAVTTEDSIFGIDIKLYGENENLIYCSNIQEVKLREWLNYINSLRKINDNWYVEEKD